MDNVDITEQWVLDRLVTKAKEFGEKAPRVIVISRVVGGNSQTLTRTVRFALVVSLNNSNLVNKLIRDTLENNFIYNFVGSEINLQSELEVDYLYFEAKIMAKES